MELTTNSMSSNYIFIDCGAHTGESIDRFRQASIYHAHPWQIYSFECVPELFAGLRAKYGSDERITLSSSAVSDAAGTTSLYVTGSRKDNVLWGSSSIVREKTTGNLVKTRPVVVNTIDLSRWIIDSFQPTDTIYLKMDIEGAEYAVLDKMFKDGSIGYVNRLFIEFHHTKLAGFPVSEHDRIVSNLHRICMDLVIEQPGHVSGNWFEQDARHDA